MEKGQKVRFWQTIKGKPTLREGIFKGYNHYNHKAIVVTGHGTETYTHYLKENKLIVMPEDNQEELDFE